MTREEIIATAARITELRAEISRLTGLREELKHLEALIDGLADSAPPDSRVGNMVARVTTIVNSRPMQEWTSEQVHLALQDSKLPSVRAALSKAIQSKQIKKVNRNRFMSLIEEPVATTEQKEGSDNIAA